MENMMSEMMKNFGSFANTDFTKNIGSFKDLDAGKISRQVLDFQKNAFDNTFDAMVKMQDQSENMAASLMGDNKSSLHEGRKTIDEWKLAFRKNQIEFKKTLDDNYSQFVSYLTPKTSEPESKSAK